MQPQDRPQLTLFARLTIGDIQRDIPIANPTEATNLQDKITGLIKKREAAMVAIDQVDTALIALCRGEALPVKALAPITLSGAVTESIVNLRSNIQAEIERPLESEQNNEPVVSDFDKVDQSSTTIVKLLNEPSASPTTVDLICSNPHCRKPFTRDFKTWNRNRTTPYNWCKKECANIGHRLLQKEAKKQAKGQSSTAHESQKLLSEQLSPTSSPSPNNIEVLAGCGHAVAVTKETSVQPTHCNDLHCIEWAKFLANKKKGKAARHPEAENLLD